MTVPGKRVLLTGMGGELGTAVAARLEDLAWVHEVVGVDIDPPRGGCGGRASTGWTPVTGAAAPGSSPTSTLTCSCISASTNRTRWATPASAAARTAAGAVNSLGAAVDCRSLEAIVVRSGIEIYGRGRGAPIRPDEQAEPQPTCEYGRSLIEVEDIASEVGHLCDVPVTLLRVAPVLGPHVPSPLGRYLRLPMVPVDVLSQPTFSLLHVDDAAAAVVEAIRAGVDGPLNIVGGGAVTPLQAARKGNRIPVPVAGLAWRLLRPLTALAGAPLPDHIVELLVRGRTADPAVARALLGVTPAYSTDEVVKELYRWASVTHLRPLAAAA